MPFLRIIENTTHLIILIRKRELKFREYIKKREKLGEIAWKLINVFEWTDDRLRRKRDDEESKVIYSNKERDLIVHVSEGT